MEERLEDLSVNNQKLIDKIKSYRSALNNFLTIQLSRKEVSFDNKKQAFYVQSTLLDKLLPEHQPIDELTGLELANKFFELKEIITSVKTVAQAHRENSKAHPITWFFKCNWLRSPKSFNEFKNFFDVSSNTLKVKP